MKNKLINFIFLISFIPVTISHAQTHKSILFTENEAAETTKRLKNENSGIDFFELSKKYQAPEAKPNWENGSTTVNMSQHDREQYYFNQRQYASLNFESQKQKIDSLQRSRQQGQISDQQYQQQLNLIKMQNAPNKPESMGFTIPFGDD